jgi:hypothetical protein
MTTMRKRCGLWKLAMGCVTGTVVASTLGIAHHSFSAQYDAGQPITVKGYVTKLEWTNPHTYFYLDVFDENDNATSWAFEMGAPIVLQRMGWNPRSLKVGDEVEVDGFLARDGSPLVNASSVHVLATGEHLKAMTAPPTN